MMPGWGYTAGLRQPNRFEEQYHCFSAAYADRGHLEAGDKILLPPSAFDTLARLNVDYPMLFQLQSPDKGTLTHCGVLEFTAEEGSIYIPFWMMQNLLITEGSLITVTNVSLPKATFVKLQPQHVDFLEISNPRAVLEHALRNFSCVTKGDVICVPYNSKNYHFELKEVKPKDAACIIETDCNVDFDAPVGYKEPTTKSESSSKGGINLPTTDDGENGLNKTGTDAKSSSSEVDESKPKGIQIVDGNIIRPDYEDKELAPDSSIIAKSIGSTGVQENAFIPIKAPKADYWAITAGNGGRLDGKKPSLLKDKDGNEIDVQKLRAESAEKRIKALEEERNNAFLAAAGNSTTSSSLSTSSGQDKKNKFNTEEK